MSKIKYSLSWDQYRNRICQGLSALQQNGEFVDMTLAADGHHVQVHQMVLSLASPYIKELIGSANCPHPVIFLNNISYTTLCSILEYVYTGEAVVAEEDLTLLLQASRALHIQGLEEMTNSQHLQMEQSNNMQISNQDLTYDSSTDMHEGFHKDEDDESFFHESDVKPSIHKFDQSKDSDGSTSNDMDKQSILGSHLLRYTLSNHGNLQIVLNRYIYGLKYSAKSSHRIWRCVNHSKKQCPALVVTKDNRILERKASHNHPFHDQRILKKFSEGSIFDAINDAEKKLVNIKKQKELKKCSINISKDTTFA